MGEKRYIRRRGAAIAAEVNEHPDEYGGVQITARFADAAVWADRIAGFQLGRAKWTTPEDIRAWIEDCRTEQSQAVQPA